MSGEEHYATGTKKHWRRTMWNAIRARIHGQVKDATCVYLSAADDHDRIEALKRGFAPKNLMAVDRDQAAVDAIRGRGQLAICGDIFEVAKTYRSPISVFHADMLGGVTKNTAYRMQELLLMPHMINTVFMFNLLRGRDGDAQSWRDGCTEYYGADLFNKHRGEFLFCIAVGKLTHTLHNAYLQEHPDRYRFRNLSELDARTKLAEIVAPMCEPVKFTYASDAKPLKYDSVVFKNPYGAVTNGALKYSDETSEALYDEYNKKDPRLVRKLAAFKAQRTIQYGD